MQYTIKERKSLPESEFLLVLEIKAEEVAAKRARLLQQMKKDTEFPGFRKGFVPEKMIRERVGEMALWEEAAADTLSEALAEIFQAEKLDVIGVPRVEARKLAPENPAEFKVTVYLYPNLTVPDYKKIAAEKNSKKQEPITVEEKEIDTVIAEIKKKRESSAGLPGEEGKKDIALTDETVKKFGRFETISDFRAMVKEGLVSHKEERNREKRRAELLDTIAEKSHGDMPSILIESELSLMENELRGQIEKIGVSFEEYLKEIKKDRDTIRKDWKKDAERRARLQLALFQIARAEKLAPAKEEIDAEVRHILEHYKNASPENARNYIETILTNQKVLTFLENL